MFHIFSLMCFLIYGVKSRSGHDRSQSFGPISHDSGFKLFQRVEPLSAGATLATDPKISNTDRSILRMIGDLGVGDGSTICPSV